MEKHEIEKLLLAGMGEWQKGYQHKVLGEALQRKGIEKAGNRLSIKSVPCFFLSRFR